MTLAETALYLLSRYLHIVCTTLLVGGTLFYEMVVPVAIGDLKTEHQLAVFARARWVFRSIVWVSATILIISGIVQTAWHWPKYAAEPRNDVAIRSIPAEHRLHTPAQRSGWWWAAHTGAGIVAVVVSLSLTIGGRPPEHPVGWMRLNLVVLLIVIFLATATRHVRQVTTEREFTNPRFVNLPD
jgi:peptidoglycan/LPS O-acetylase OafA/YrhL